MPGNMDEDIISAVERLKNSKATPEDITLIGDAVAAGKIEITPSSQSQHIQQSGGTNFGEDNEIRVTGSVIGTQTINGISGEQVLEILKLSEEKEEAKSRSNVPIIAAVIGTIGVIVAGYFGFRGPIEAALIPIRATQTAEAKTQAASIPETGRSPTPTSAPPTSTQTLVSTSTHTSPPPATETPTATITPTPTFTNTPTPTFTPTPEVLFTDTFDDYEYSTVVGWILVTEREGKVYHRLITQKKVDNKFVHEIDCQSTQCVGRNEIPFIDEFKNFVLRFDIEYQKIPPAYTGLSRPFICLNFRRYDSQNFYALCFRSNGEYRMLRYLNNELTIIKDWELSPVLKPGPEKNTISLTADRANYLFEANGSEIDSFEDNNLLSASGIEIAIYSFQNNPDSNSFVELELDNLEIINIP